ncbi:ATP synthase F1 subunit delta [Persicimonas caeni]|uniref:ATP synthase subunit delta n=1 Tax=Persicimonas caeni TaxID=2292766 RepID=A0A4Y6PR27_PERCE|nr:ATP synthase F1 subunit delta [Persicimonas caeni]QDG50782.1 ATP synthase F1 subunit delta [Persicimonas caeni]QED32003.1 ATP synthase F1 subunit delta [Persicimonas caeni]
MAGEPVARRYAQALLDIGVEQNNYEKLRDQLDELAEIYGQSKPFRTALLNPSIGLDERRKIVRAIAQKRGWHQMITNFALLLLDNDRFRLVPTIARTFGERVDEKAGNIRAKVTSAVDLNEAQKSNIRKALGEITGKNVLLETDVDESLLGGAVTRIGSMVYDGSIRSQIERLRESILAEV